MNTNEAKTWAIITALAAVSLTINSHVSEFMLNNDGRAIIYSIHASEKLGFLFWLGVICLAFCASLAMYCLIGKYVYLEYYAFALPISLRL